MNTLSRAERQRILYNVHTAWALANVGGVADEFEPRGEDSDYNVHNVDIDASGEMEDELADLLAAALDAYTGAAEDGGGKPQAAQATTAALSGGDLVRFNQLHPRTHGRFGHKFERYLGEGEHVTRFAEAPVDGHSEKQMPMARIDTPDGPRIRIGAVDDAEQWQAGGHDHDRIGQIDARVAEIEDLFDSGYDGPDADALDRERDTLEAERDRLEGPEDTVQLTSLELDRARSDVAAAVAQAQEWAQQDHAAWAGQRALDKAESAQLARIPMDQRTPDQVARLAELSDKFIFDLDGSLDVSGELTGEHGGILHWNVLGDDDGAWTLHVGVVGDEDDSGEYQDSATFGPEGAQRLLGMWSELAAEPTVVAAHLFTCMHPHAGPCLSTAARKPRVVNNPEFEKKIHRDLFGRFGDKPDVPAPKKRAPRKVAAKPSAADMAHQLRTSHDPEGTRKQLGKLTVAELGVVAGHLGRKLAGKTKAQKIDSLLGVSSHEDALTHAARDRQARIDGVRAPGAIAAMVVEDVGADVDLETIKRSARTLAVRAATERPFGSPAAENALRVANAVQGADSVDQLDDMMRKLITEMGGEIAGEPDDIVPYDARLHDLLPGSKARKGQRVAVIRPGIRWSEEDAPIEKAHVYVLDAAELQERLGKPGDGTSPRLKSALDSGVRDERPLAGGAMAQTSRVTFNDGTEGVRKKIPGIIYDAQGVQEKQDAEELSVAVARALGIRVPEVVRTEPDEVMMEYIPWKSGMAGTDEDRKKRELALRQNRSMQRIGVLDLLIGNPDRNPGNYLIEDLSAPESSTVAAIDHGLAFAEVPVDKLHAGPFGKPFKLGQERLSTSDQQKIARALKEVRPQFVRMGRLDWFDRMMARFGELKVLAEGNPGEEDIF